MSAGQRLVSHASKVKLFDLLCRLAKPCFFSVRTKVFIIGEVGLLHSITGDLSRLERMAVNAERMAIQEINDVGGLLGMKIVPVIADGESDPDVRIRF